MKRVLILSLLINFTATAQSTYTLYFDSDKSELKQPSIRLLDSLSNVLMTRSDYHLKISGYCDNSGEVTSNQLLSEKRAKEVARYLKARKVNPQLIDVKGFSDSHPVGSNQDAIGKARNRRVELVMILPVIIAAKAPTEVKQVEVKPVVAEPTKPNPEQPKAEILAEKIKPEDMVPGKIFILNNLIFMDGTADLMQESKPALMTLLKVLKENPRLTIEIEGHVCCQHDMQLSIERALTVLEYLVKNGVDERRLKYAGHSNFMPVADESTQQGQKQNRRVEITVLTNK
jgi:outer membrane protein OmpA-like peptidoglycan-associated protein